MNNGVSLHSTSDAEGIVRRGSFSINCSTATVLLEALFIGQLGPATGQDTLDALIAAGPDALTGAIQGSSQLGQVIAPIIGAISAACPQIFDPSLGGASAAAADERQGAARADGPPAPGADEPPAPEGEPGLGTQDAPEAQSDGEAQRLEPEAEPSGGQAPAAPLETGESNEDGAG